MGGPVLGFAVIDRQVGHGVTAVWLTTRITSDRVGHTNAVCVADDDPDGSTKLRSLIADRAVILTAGSEHPLPLMTPIQVDTIGSLVTETTEYQRRIVEAVDAYVAKSRSKNLVRPDFPPAPVVPELRELPDAAQRALATANYVARAWSAWLATDEQRRRRTVDPRKGTSPWIMPDDMNSPDVAEFSSAFAEHVRPEPVS
jgi:hypothetical protein